MVFVSCALSDSVVSCIQSGPPEGDGHTFFRGDLMKKLVFLIAVVCAAAFAQTTSSRITGTITDPAGSAVPGASITVLNTVTGQSFTTSTGNQGEYAVPSIPAAIYRL